MTATTTYVARHNGKTVARRNSHRDYAYAVVALDWDEAAAKAKLIAKLNSPEGEKDARGLYRYYESTVKQGATSWFPQSEIDKLAAKIEGGFEAFRARNIEAILANFDAHVPVYRKPVASWTSRLDLAQKEAARTAKLNPHHRTVVILPAEKA